MSLDCKRNIVVLESYTYYMATQFKTLKEYLYPDNGHKIFVIPNYQRGYKWSVRTDNDDTSVEFLVKSLKMASSSKNEQQFFLQGVTVV